MICPPPPLLPRVQHTFAPFHSRMVEQDPGEIIELELRNSGTEVIGIVACGTLRWSTLTALSVEGGKVA